MTLPISVPLELRAQPRAELASSAPDASEPWWPAAWPWLAAGLAFTLFTAAFRPDDLRRLLSRK
ncbi:MAG TPA: hypothetical protein VMN78_06105 [Longimicrobiales bacterium]|nr:hypothetical protein [Longimicrobiales bacterium]